MFRSLAKSGKAIATKLLKQKWLSIVQLAREKGENGIGGSSTVTLLELFSSSDAGSGEPVHGFLLDVGISESFFEISFKGDKSPERLVGKTLLVVNFSPRSSGPFLHIGQGIGDLPVIIMVEGLIDKEIKVDRVQPSLGCLCLSIIFIGASDVNLGNPRTSGGGGGSSSRGSRGLVRHGGCDW